MLVSPGGELAVSFQRDCKDLHVAGQLARVNLNASPEDREKFEKWLVQSVYFNMPEDYKPARHIDGDYNSPGDQSRWLGWQGKNLPWEE